MILVHVEVVKNIKTAAEKIKKKEKLIFSFFIVFNSYSV